ncbi:MAG: Flp pilus assembly complex ATPase component TadA [Oscillospiraceae bacterium]|nr:Flp pilus assembly complex ATPase component TadA [Oscillospiraceae bacterium]
MKNVPIGQILLENGYITKQHLEDALVKQKDTGKKLGDMLLELGYVSETQLAQALSQRLKVPFIDLTTTKVESEAVKKIPEAVAKKNTVIAFKINNGRLYVATNDPVNFYIFEELKIQTGMEIHPMLATKSSIVEAIGKVYSANQVSNVMNDIDKEYDANEALMQEDDASEERIDNAPVVKLVNTIIESAYRDGASDIHIEPFKDRTRIRYRIDGECVEKMAVKPAVHNSIITRIKILGGMNIAEKRIPLDGRSSAVIDGVNQDLRISTIPTVFGEKCVIRLLATGDEKARKITDLGMTDYNY